eukprot:TRINITY_DN8774_c0_g1_i1.p1 TRINITY_DN8774_c0_g1~~TRINITY_DN8774_c0_g1_i1.p1  ORF type:complete len:297 (-),score=22.99 TRINITY_DN8774_c0_g1_i1:66-956(-)
MALSRAPGLPPSNGSFVGDTEYSRKAEILHQYWNGGLPNGNVTPPMPRAPAAVNQYASGLTPMTPMTPCGGLQGCQGLQRSNSWASMQQTGSFAVPPNGSLLGSGYLGAAATGGYPGLYSQGFGGAAYGGFQQDPRAGVWPVDRPLAGGVANLPRNVSFCAPVQQSPAPLQQTASFAATAGWNGYAPGVGQPPLFQFYAEDASAQARIGGSASARPSSQPAPGRPAPAGAGPNKGNTAPNNNVRPPAAGGRKEPGHSNVVRPDSGQFARPAGPKAPPKTPPRPSGTPRRRSGRGCC